MITQDQLENFFAETRETYRSGRSTWSIDGVCRWSYFFVDTDRGKLLPIAKHLETLGYEFIGTLDPDESNETSAYFLRMDRIERHSPQSLHELNQGLYDVAARFGVSSYDGMDVGSVDGP
ncbi:ribonuclease E inhibitor RraB [Duganella hordei]|uniref:ribonuclease E inhibitor RraB n=1 Tax=Duganella hordei TaxID=2865934 RepID=UPI003341D34A